MSPHTSTQKNHTGQGIYDWPEVSVIALKRISASVNPILVHKTAAVVNRGCSEKTSAIHRVEYDKQDAWVFCSRSPHVDC